MPGGRCENRSLNKEWWGIVYVKTGHGRLTDREDHEDFYDDVTDEEDTTVHWEHHATLMDQHAASSTHTGAGTHAGN